MSWSSNSSEVGENVTVRCDCGSSRPQPSLRWFRGFTDVTEWAHITLSQTDSQGRPCIEYFGCMFVVKKNNHHKRHTDNYESSPAIRLSKTIMPTVRDDDI